MSSRAGDLETAAASARELLAEVRGTLKDLKAARREMEEYLRTEVSALIKEELAHQVQMHVGALGEETRKAMDRAVAKVGREFDRLESVFLGTEKGGGRPPLEDMMRARMETP